MAQFPATFGAVLAGVVLGALAACAIWRYARKAATAKSLLQVIEKSGLGACDYAPKPDKLQPRWVCEHDNEASRSMLPADAQ